MYGIVCTQIVADVCTVAASFYVYRRFVASMAETDAKNSEKEGSPGWKK